MRKQSFSVHLQMREDKQSVHEKMSGIDGKGTITNGSSSTPGANKIYVLNRFDPKGVLCW